MRHWIVLLLLLVPFAAQAQDTSTPPFSPDRDFYIDAWVDNLTPYVGQQILYTFRLYDTGSPAGSQQKLPDFEGFWVGEKPPSRSHGEMIGGRQYIIVEQEIPLYPTRTGDIVIAPAEYLIPARGITLATQPLALQVQPLLDGAPDKFNGAVGQFIDMTANVDQQSVNLGDPVTLQLTIRGAGNLEQLSPPKLPALDGWRAYASPPVIVHNQDGLRIGEKTFQWVLVSDQAGPRTIPAIVFSYFDPQSASYRSIATAPITIDVLGEAGSEQAALPTATRASSPAAEVLPLKPVPASLDSSNLYPGAGFWLLWALPPAATGLGWLWVYQQQRRKRSLQNIRQVRALNRAKSHLRAALKSQDRKAYRLISEAIYIYFGDKLRCPAKQLSASTLSEAMSEHSIDSQAIQQVLACLEWAEAGKYAPVGSEDVRPLASRTLEALAAIDRAWTAK